MIVGTNRKERKIIRTDGHILKNHSYHSFQYQNHLIDLSIKVSTGGIISRKEQTTKSKRHTIRTGQKNTQEGRMHQKDRWAHRDKIPAIKIATIRLRLKIADNRKEETHNQYRNDELIVWADASAVREGT